MKHVIPFRPTGTSGDDAQEATATLRAVAELAAAAGLEVRLKAALAERVASGALDPGGAYGEDERRGWMHGAAMRGLAAAAIVLIVVGGGWGVAEFGRQSATPQAARFPHATPGGDFSNAGAMRTPRTLTLPAAPKPRHDAQKMDEAKSAKPQTGKHAKADARHLPKGAASGSHAPER